MAGKTLQRAAGGAWELARSQHGVVGRGQLLRLGYSAKAIDHRLAKGRLHTVGRGVYALGRPELTQHGRWMAAVLSCGRDAVLSHRSAAALWAIGEEHPLGAVPITRIEVSVPRGSYRSRPGLLIHRRSSLTGRERTVHELIPVTTPIATLIDLAAVLNPGQLERAIAEADKRGLASPGALRAALDELSRRPGIAPLRKLLDRHTFRLTDSELERRFLRIVRAAGLALPLTRSRVNGFRVDFFWRELGLIVETDGLRYHRTAAQQSRDRTRDQAHAAAGYTQLRFTHAQVRYEPDSVRTTLAAVAYRLSRGAGTLLA